MQENERQRVSCGKFCNFCSQKSYFPPPPLKWMNLISDRLSTASIKYLTWPSPLFGWFENGCNKVVTEPRVVQFWSEITRMISAQIAIHSIQLPLWIKVLKWNFFMEIVSLSTSLPQQLSHSYSSVFRSFFFSFFCFCFFLVSYTPNFKIFTRITFTYEFLPISFLSCLNAYFFMLSFFTFSSDFYVHLTASQGFPLWFDILHWWHARYSTQLLLWIQTQTWSCLGW